MQYLQIPHFKIDHDVSLNIRVDNMLKPLKGGYTDITVNLSKLIFLLYYAKTKKSSNLIYNHKNQPFSKKWIKTLIYHIISSSHYPMCGVDLSESVSYITV